MSARPGEGRGGPAPAWSAESCLPAPDGSCSICGDEGQLGEVVELTSPTTARVRLDGSVREVAIDLVEGVRRGDRLVIHLGFAIARVRDEVPAARGWPGGASPPTDEGREEERAR